MGGFFGIILIVRKDGICLMKRLFVCLLAAMLAVVAVGCGEPKPVDHSFDIGVNAVVPHAYYVRENLAEGANAMIMVPADRGEFSANLVISRYAKAMPTDDTAAFAAEMGASLAQELGENYRGELNVQNISRQDLNTAIGTCLLVRYTYAYTFTTSVPYAKAIELMGTPTPAQSPDAEATPAPAYVSVTREITVYVEEFFVEHNGEVFSFAMTCDQAKETEQRVDIQSIYTGLSWK